jgi:hypothetical protein
MSGVLDTVADLSGQAQMAIEFASEVSKQLINLAAGVLALSFTFLKDLAKASHRRSKFLLMGWGLLVISMPFGIMTLMTIAGHLARQGEATGQIIYEGNTVTTSGIQVFSFFGGLCCLVAFAWTAIDTNESKADREEPPKKPRQRGPRR